MRQALDINTFAKEEDQFKVIGASSGNMPLGLYRWIEYIVLISSHDLSSCETTWPAKRFDQRFGRHAVSRDEIDPAA
jgi:hypothetical protein